MSPPRRPRFFRKWIFCWARVVGSDSSQNRCPAYVVGTMEPIRAKAAIRRYFPAAKRTPPAICTAPLMRTSVSALSWSTPTLSLRGSVTASAFLAFPAGFQRASHPPTTKMDASSGRAILRESAMALSLPVFQGVTH